MYILYKFYNICVAQFLNHSVVSTAGETPEDGVKMHADVNSLIC